MRWNETALAWDAERSVICTDSALRLCADSNTLQYPMCWRFLPTGLMIWTVQHLLFQCCTKKNGSIFWPWLCDQRVRGEFFPQIGSFPFPSGNCPLNFETQCDKLIVNGASQQLRLIEWLTDSGSSPLPHSAMSFSSTNCNSRETWCRHSTWLWETHQSTQRTLQWRWPALASLLSYSH